MGADSGTPANLKGTCPTTSSSVAWMAYVVTAQETGTAVTAVTSESTLFGGGNCS